MNKAVSLLCLYCCFSFLSYGQQNGPEVLTPLRVNAELSKAKNAASYTMMKSPSEEFYYLLDTLSLPFVDDFSRYNLKNYDTLNYNQALVVDSMSFAFTVDGIPLDSFFCATDTTWSYLFNPDSTLNDTTKLTEYEIVHYNNPYNPFVPTDTTYCWSPFEVYDTVFQFSPDTIDSLGITIDTLVNAFDTLSVYPPDTGLGGTVLSLWIDEDAFINSRYPIDPVTIGVATLDGLNEFGVPHNGFSDPAAYGVADFLTSKPIALADTMNEVYLSFYYQPQGIGNDPQSEDSLVLEFYAPKEFAWHNIWSVPGKSTQNFRHVIVQVTGSEYLQKGFQFRFKNYATISGAMDHWHIDYVRLNNNRSAEDSLIVDVAVVEATRSIYKTYEAVPWKHYLADTTLALADSMAVIMRNLDSVKNRTDYHYLIKHNDGVTDSSLLFPTIINEKDVQPVSSLVRGLPLDYYCNWSAEPDSATFEIITALEPESKDVNSNNDTVRYYQNFYNYYAYDDGTAEASYYLNTSGAKLAYQFTTIIPDTLRAVDMYFAQNIEDQSQEEFYLTVWSSLTPETIIYQREKVKPAFEDSLNEFHTYLLDTVLVVSGTYYIGWLQLSDAALNIGYDFNSDKSSKTYYNTSGTWLQSLLGGTMMIRPLFGDSVILPMAIEEAEVALPPIVQFAIFPNPANDHIQIQLDEHAEPGSSIEVTIVDMYGRLVVSEMSSSGLVDVKHLAGGIYFVKVRIPGTTEFETKKIFVSH